MTVCTACHGLEDIVASRHTKADWKKVVEKMISFGAEAKDEEVEVIVNYLAKNFGKTDAASNLKASAPPAK
jgi:hypothetical protein